MTQPLLPRTTFRTDVACICADVGITRIEADKRNIKRLTEVLEDLQQASKTLEEYKWLVVNSQAKGPIDQEIERIAAEIRRLKAGLPEESRCVIL
jgi:hypothetical protein